jgi:hypothetical protein
MASTTENAYRERLNLQRQIEEMKKEEADVLQQVTENTHAATIAGKCRLVVYFVMHVDRIRHRTQHVLLCV